MHTRIFGWILLLSLFSVYVVAPPASVQTQEDQVTYEDFKESMKSMDTAAEAINTEPAHATQYFQEEHGISSFTAQGRVSNFDPGTGRMTTSGAASTTLTIDSSLEGASVTVNPDGSVSIDHGPTMVGTVNKLEHDTESGTFSVDGTVVTAKGRQLEVTGDSLQFDDYGNIRTGSVTDIAGVAFDSPTAISYDGDEHVISFSDATVTSVDSMSDIGLHGTVTVDKSIIDQFGSAGLHVPAGNTLDLRIMDNGMFDSSTTISGGNNDVNIRSATTSQFVDLQYENTLTIISQPGERTTFDMMGSDGGYRAFVNYHDVALPKRGYFIVGDTDATTNGEVTKVQEMLVSMGYMKEATGYYGPITKDAVSRLQTDTGTTVDGAFGSDTLKSVGVLIEPGDNPSKDGNGRVRVGYDTDPIEHSSYAIDVAGYASVGNYVSDTASRNIYHYDGLDLTRKGGRDVDYAQVDIYKSDNHDILYRVYQYESSEEATYTVKQDETLSHIALRFGTSVDAIAAENGIDPNVIYPGQKLSIPGVSGESSSVREQSTVRETETRIGREVAGTALSYQDAVPVQTRNDMGVSERVSYFHDSGRERDCAEFASKVLGFTTHYKDGDYDVWGVGHGFLPASGNRVATTSLHNPQAIENTFQNLEPGTYLVGWGHDYRQTQHNPDGMNIPHLGFARYREGKWEIVMGGTDAKGGRRKPSIENPIRYSTQWENNYNSFCQNTGSCHGVPAGSGKLYIYDLSKVK